MEISAWLSDHCGKHCASARYHRARATDTLADAASVLLHEQISGAPVLDESGACVGVLSVTDVIRAQEKVAQEAQKVAQSPFWSSNLILPASIYAEQLAKVRDKLAPAAEQPVEHFMTSNLVTVTESDALAKVVQFMVDAHVHRVVVLDDKHQLRGVISTTDVLAGLLHAGK